MAAYVDQAIVNPPTSNQSQSPVTIRTMVQEDAEFVADMSVEAFRSKYEWAIGKKR